MKVSSLDPSRWDPVPIVGQGGLGTSQHSSRGVRVGWLSYSSQNRTNEQKGLWRLQVRAEEDDLGTSMLLHCTEHQLSLDFLVDLR